MYIMRRQTAAAITACSVITSLLLLVIIDLPTSHCLAVNDDGRPIFSLQLRLIAASRRTWVAMARAWPAGVERHGMGGTCACAA